ncbi:hypothetical protein [Pseudonocardia sp. ICBG1293]|uniref:hypothetical protein n=1 Tax=Pseudonocardia sp. ICBG1293 TaxID=2844382 RepID=UPI001CCFABDB|nr:hypothetical protein [Pseudonocardia sp. ICBG1293]
MTFLRRFSNGEWAEAVAMRSDDTAVWHNDGQGDTSIHDNVTARAAKIDAVTSMEYDIVR